MVRRQGLVTKALMEKCVSVDMKLLVGIWNVSAKSGSPLDQCYERPAKYILHNPCSQLSVAEG